MSNELMEQLKKEKIQKLSEHYLEILRILGEDTTREGLIMTPERISKAMLTLTKGYSQDPAEVLRSAMFKEDYKQMVIVKDIDFYSMCEHHMLTLFWKSSRGIYTEELHHRTKQDPTRC